MPALVNETQRSKALADRSRSLTLTAAVFGGLAFASAIGWLMVTNGASTPRASVRDLVFWTSAVIVTSLATVVSGVGAAVVSAMAVSVQPLASAHEAAPGIDHYS